jgi:hypothetical protein
VVFVYGESRRKAAILRKLLFNIVFFPEPFDASGGVYQFLLAGKERVAGGTNFNLDVSGGGTGFYNVPAGAGYLCHFVLGVNSRSHFYPPKIVQLRPTSTYVVGSSRFKDCQSKD